MKKLTRADVLDIIQYEKARKDFRARVIELKKGRRITVGPFVTLVFENRETVLFQIQEMMRAERIVRDEEIAFEIEVYNGLIPGPNELSATLFIEITDQRRIKPTLDKLMGIDRGKRVWLEFGGERVAGVFERGRSKDDKISAVHFVRFRFTPGQARRFRAGEDKATLVIHHPNYQRRALLPEPMRQSLAEDLAQ